MLIATDESGLARDGTAMESQCGTLDVFSHLEAKWLTLACFLFFRPENQFCWPLRRKNILVFHGQQLLLQVETFSMLKNFIFSSNHRSMFSSI